MIFLITLFVSLFVLPNTTAFVRILRISRGNVAKPSIKIQGCPFHSLNSSLKFRISSILLAVAPHESEHGAGADTSQKSTVIDTVTVSNKVEQRQLVSVSEPGSATASRDLDQVAWERGYTTCKKEVCEIVSTTMPSDLRGTFYRNGFAKFEAGKEKIKHPFDGDGMIHAVTFNGDGTALYRNRFIRTKIFEKERKAQRILERGAFGTQKGGGILGNFLSVKLRDVSNTNVVYYGKRLLSLFESTSPHVIEADSLRTLKKTTMNGLLDRNQPFSAHPKIDANTGRLVNFSARLGTTSAAMTVYEFDQEFRCVKTRDFSIPGFVMFHDFAVTEHFYLFMRPPIELSPLSFALGLTGIAECISFKQGRLNEIYIVPRNGVDPIEVVEVDPHFNFHFSNAYEDADGTIVLDTVRCSKMEFGQSSLSDRPIWEELDFAAVAPYTTLERYTLSRNSTGSALSMEYTAGGGNTGGSNTDPNGVGGADRGGWIASASTRLSDSMVDFPVVNPRVVGKKNRFVFASLSPDTSKPNPPRAAIKFDLELGTETTWVPEPYEFIGELVFAPKTHKAGETSIVAGEEGEEDVGYLLTYLWNGRDCCSELLVFDAEGDLSQGPISRVPLPTNVGHGLHGCFAPDLVFPPDDVTRKFKAFSALDGKWNEMKGGFSGLGISYDF